MPLGRTLSPLLRRLRLASPLGPTAAAEGPLRIRLAPGAEDNGLAVMLGDLVQQNLEAKPHKKADFETLDGRVAIVADDAGVALTMVFERVFERVFESVFESVGTGGGARPSASGGLTIHDGIVGIPDVTIRGPSEAIIALSNMPLRAPFGLPLPSRGDADGQKVFDELSRLMRAGTLHFYGMPFHVPLVMKLTRVMSVNG